MAESQPQVEAHVPAIMVWRHKAEQKSMTNFRRMPGIERGNCMLYIFTVSENPFPITMLSGDEFLSAWWQVVLGHYALWKHYVHHRDVSPGNLRVYRSDGRWIGVLNDHDLSSTQRNRPAGNERTGTVPFMAIDLLEDDTFEGKVTHLYRHDAESFVWVLVWVSLRYRDGKLLRVREGRLLDEWLTVDAIRCREKKCGFQWTFRFGDAEDTDIQPSSSHISNWKISVACLCTLHYAPRAQIHEDESILQTWLLENVKSVTPDITLRYPVNLSQVVLYHEVIL